MNQDSKKKKFVSILSKVAQERRQKAEKKLSEHQFNIPEVQQKNQPFEMLVLRAVMEQADSMSSVMGKPHQYQVFGEHEARLGKQAYETLKKSMSFNVLPVVSLATIKF